MPLCSPHNTHCMSLSKRSSIITVASAKPVILTKGHVIPTKGHVTPTKGHVIPTCYSLCRRTFSKNSILSIIFPTCLSRPPKLSSKGIQECTAICWEYTWSWASHVRLFRLSNAILASVLSPPLTLVWVIVKARMQEWGLEHGTQIMHRK